MDDQFEQHFCKSSADVQTQDQLQPWHGDGVNEEPGEGQAARLRQRYTCVENNFRAPVIDAFFNRAMPASQVAELLNINRTTVYGILTIYRDEGQIDRSARGVTRVLKLSDDAKSMILSWIDQYCTLSLVQLKNMVQEFFGLE